MPNTLYAKLIVILLLLLVPLAIFYTFITLYTSQRYPLEVSQRLNWRLAENLVTGEIIDPKGDLDRTATSRLFSRLMLVNPGIELYLLDIDGNILTYSPNLSKVGLKQVDLKPIERFMHTSRFPVFGDNPRTPGQPTTFSVASVPKEGPPRGYIYVVLSDEAYQAVAASLRGSYITRLSLAALGIGALFTVVTGFVMFNLLTRRLRRLTQGVMAFEQNGFQEAVRIPRTNSAWGEDEIDHLSETFNQMEETILEQLRQLRNSDAMRRELIANVSHDLRTPIAALRGYLETLLMKSDFTPEEQKTYLTTALKHSERLSHLVTDLFELAKLDTNPAVHLEPFRICELVHDIAQKYRLSANQKGVMLEVTQDHNVLVNGDIGLIERAITNLVDNALRHTPAGGRVMMSLVQTDSLAIFSVGDTGQGIPKEDLPRIFDRFYRVEKNRPEVPGGTGLGLAIVKRILDLHQRSIEVQSQPGIGTTFVFSFPVVKERVSRETQEKPAAIPKPGSHSRA
jgi:signal transduction histidine kinase